MTKTPYIAPRVDLATAELELTSSIYEGFSTAIMVKGQARTVALCREYSDAVQLMAIVANERAKQPEAGTERTDGRLAEIISDDEVIRVHGHANFGPTMTPRAVVNEGVLKYAIGYHSGHTQLSILLEHGLIIKPRPGSYDANLTKKGKKYARALHCAGISLADLKGGHTA